MKGNSGQNNPARRGRPRISVLIADDHPFIRHGVWHVLEREPDIRVVAAVADASAALSETARLMPNVVIMDITMPGMNGIEATRLLADKMPATAVIILSTHCSPIIVRRAVEAGACGYVSKDLPSEELIRAVRAAAAGKRYIGQGLLQGLLDVRKGVGDSEHTPQLLTTTEQNIIQLVAEGKSNREVAAIIGLSPRTVETYRLRLMRKLELDGLPSLIKYAIRHGLVPLE